MLPIYELGLYRLFERWSIMFKMSVGFVILLTNMAGYFVIEVVDYTVYEKSNATTCLLVQDSLDSGHHRFLLAHYSKKYGVWVSL